MSVRRWIPFPILAASILTLAGPAISGGREDALEIKGWGRVTDPDGDCKVFVEEGRLTIAIPGTVHALSAERGQMNAPRILREVAGDFIAEAKVSGVAPPQAPSLVRERRPFCASGLILWQDDRTYIRLERAGMVLNDEGVIYANFESREHGRFERAGDANELPLDGEETYLRLERRGKMVLASVSTDGRSWKSLEPLAVDLPERVRVGVAATHNTSAPFRPRLGGYKLSRGSGRPIVGP